MMLTPLKIYDPQQTAQVAHDYVSSGEGTLRAFLLQLPTPIIPVVSRVFRSLYPDLYKREQLLQRGLRPDIVEYRLKNPRSRVTSQFAYYHNGTNVQQMYCIFCRSLGPSWCGRYPKTKRAKDWEGGHECGE